MGSDVSLLIFDPRIGAMVRVRHLGGRAVVARADEVLGAPPIASRLGYESFSVTPEQALAIAKSSYSQGARPDEVARLALRFPSPPTWWTLQRTY